MMSHARRSIKRSGWVTGVRRSGEPTELSNPSHSIFDPGLCEGDSETTVGLRMRLLVSGCSRSSFVIMHLTGAAFRHYKPAASFGRGSGGADNVNSRPGWSRFTYT